MMIDVRYEVWEYPPKGMVVQHIVFEHPLTKSEDRRLCDNDLQEWSMKSRSKARKARIDMCPECLEAFKKSDHPEAVEYRRLFALYGGSNQ